MSTAIAFAFDDPTSPDELQRLFAQTDWARGRTVQGIAAMLGATSNRIAARSDGKLVGFARAISDGVFRALIEDVVVDEHFRGQGLGVELVRRLVDRLSDVEQIQLGCRRELIPFYEKLGFECDDTPSMHRSTV